MGGQLPPASAKERMMTTTAEVRDKISSKEEIKGITEEFGLTILADFCGYKRKEANKKWEYWIEDDNSI